MNPIASIDPKILWLFGGVGEQAVYLRDPRRMSGVLELERATVRWFLSIDADDLPDHFP